MIFYVIDVEVLCFVYIGVCFFLLFVELYLDLFVECLFVLMFGELDWLFFEKFFGVYGVFV